MKKAGGVPPEHSRFPKGQSGNPKGRPKKRASPGATSAFDIIVDKTLAIMRNGEPQEVSVEEALQHRTYKDAIAGNRLARRDILKMIAKREQALAKLTPPPRTKVSTVWEHDTENANAAMLLLGIVCPDAKDYGPNDPYERLLLEPWAVQAALSRRRGGTGLTEEDVTEIERCTRDPSTLRWPRGVRE